MPEPTGTTGPTEPISDEPTGGDMPEDTRSYLSEQYSGPEFHHEERRETEAQGAVEKLRMAANAAREVGETEVADILDKQADEKAEAMREFFDVSYEEGLRINEQATEKVAELITDYTELEANGAMRRYTDMTRRNGDSKNQGERQINDVAWKRFLATILPSQQLDAFQEYAKYMIRQYWAINAAASKLSESDRLFILSEAKRRELSKEYEQEHPAPEFNPIVHTIFGDEINLSMPDYWTAKDLINREKTYTNWELVVKRNIHPQLLLNFAILSKKER